MPYSVQYRPVKGQPPWAKVNKDTGRIASRHRTKGLAEASVKAYYANRNEAPVANVRNPLRVDPTRTTVIRVRFVAEMRRRFAALRRHVKEAVVTLDVFGIKDARPIPFRELVALARPQPREFQFQTDPQKVRSFAEWFRQQVEEDVLSVDPGTPINQPWLSKYVQSAYRRGKVNAFLSSKRQELAGERVGGQSTEEFLRTSFLQPETVSKVELLATRAFEQLKGVTANMASEMNRILAQGIADGRGVIGLAKEMTDRIDNMTERRALLISRTEVIHAHAEGQLDSFEELGVKQLGVMVEWSTAGDDRVCPICEGFEGETFTIDEARGLIPAHPACRCTWIPVL